MNVSFKIHVCVGKWTEIGKFMVHECVPWKCGKFFTSFLKILPHICGWKWMLETSIMGSSSTQECTHLACNAGNYKCVSHTMRMCDVVVYVVFTISVLVYSMLIITMFVYQVCYSLIMGSCNL